MIIQQSPRNKKEILSHVTFLNHVYLAYWISDESRQRMTEGFLAPYGFLQLVTAQTFRTHRMCHKPLGSERVVDRQGE